MISPHGKQRICSNAILSGHATQDESPVDSSAVKELYDAAGTAIIGYAVYPSRQGGHRRRQLVLVRAGPADHPARTTPTAWSRTASATPARPRTSASAATWRPASTPTPPATTSSTSRSSDLAASRRVNQRDEPAEVTPRARSLHGP